jgi:TP901 family phage tail tape measure protein
MALNAIGRLEIVFSFKDKSAAGVKSAERQLNRFKNKAKDTARQTKSAFMGAFPALITLGVVRMAGQAFMSIVRPAIEFEDSMRRMAVFANTGKEDIKAFTEEAVSDMRYLSTVTGYSTAELIDSFTEISKKGLEARVGLAAMIPITRMARIANLDLSEAVDTASTLFHVWGFAGEKLAQRMSQLAFVSRRSRLDFDELRDMITRTTTGVKLAKPAYEDFLFMVAKTRDVAPTARIAGTQLRRAYEQLAIKTRELGPALGIPLKKMQDQGFVNFADVMFDLAAKGDDLNSSQKMLAETIGIIGVRAATPFAAAFAAAKDAIAEAGGNATLARKNFFALREEIKANTSALDGMFRTYMKANLARQIDILKVSFENLSIAAGPALLAPLQRLVITFTYLAQLISGNIHSMRENSYEMETWGETIRWVADGLTSLTSALLITVAGMMLGKGTLFVLGTAARFAGLSFSFQAMAAKGLNTSLAAYTRWANVSTLATNKLTFGMRQLAWATKGVAKSLKFMHFIPLIIFAGYLIAESMGIFGNELDRMDEIAKKGGRAGDTRLQKLRDAGDKLGASLLQSAKKFEEVFGVKVPTFKESMFKRIPKVMEAIGGYANAEQWGKRLPRLVESSPALAENFKALNDLSLEGKSASKEQIENFMNLGLETLVIMRGFAKTGSAQEKFVNDLGKQFMTLQQLLQGKPGPAGELVGIHAKFRGAKFTPSGALVIALEDKQARVLSPERMKEALKPLAEELKKAEGSGGTFKTIREWAKGMMGITPKMAAAYLPPEEAAGLRMEARTRQIRKIMEFGGIPGRFTTEEALVALAKEQLKLLQQGNKNTKKTSDEVGRGVKVKAIELPEGMIKFGEG